MTTADLFPLQVPQPPARHHAKLMAAAYTVADELAARSEANLPGIQGLFRTRAILIVGRQRRTRLGTFTADSWQHDGTTLHEIHLNADRSCGHWALTTGEDAVVTLAHELAHLAAHNADIRDTSNRGRYHSKKFAVIATALGCQISRPDPAPYGFVTDRLTDESRMAYGDLIERMDDALHLHAGIRRTARTAAVDSDALKESVTANGRYVFASCDCRIGNRPRTLRMSAHQWEIGTVLCGRCHQPFTIGGRPVESQPFWSSPQVALEALRVPIPMLTTSF